MFVVADELKEQVGVDNLDGHVGRGADRGAAHPALDHAHFANELAFTNGAQNERLAIDLFDHFDRARHHPVDIGK